MDVIKNILAWLLRPWIKKHERLEAEQSYVSWTSFYTRLMWCRELEHDNCPHYIRDVPERQDITCTCPCHVAI